MIYYIILEKDLATGEVGVCSLHNNYERAVSELDSLINSTEDYGYKMVAKVIN